MRSIPSIARRVPSTLTHALRIAAIAAMLAVSTSAAAHPGNGIVVGADGTVYVADVARRTIWRVRPTGTVAPLIRNHWTHSLQLAADGTLYYEREEPVDGVAPSSLWSMAPDGTRTQLIPPQADRRQFSGAAFVVGPDRAVYYAHSIRDAGGSWRTVIMRRTPSGEVTPFTGMGTGALFTDGAPTTATIRIVTAMTLGADGALYFADRDHLRQVDLTGERAGHVTTVASGLIDATPVDPPERRGPSTTINRLYGLAATPSGEFLIAYQAGRRVIRVGVDGSTSTLHTSPSGWSPIGVAARGASRYVLEVADESIERLRVLRIDADGATATLATLR